MSIYLTLKSGTTSTGTSNNDPEYNAGEFYYDITNPAPLSTYNNNVNIKGHLFDSTVEEYIYQQFNVPDDIDTSGNTTFTWKGYSVTAAASKNIALKFGHSAIAVTEDFDIAYTDVLSGDVSVQSVQNALDVITWTVSNSTLGWVGGDLTAFRISKPAASVNNLSGDYSFRYFKIGIGRA